MAIAHYMSVRLAEAAGGAPDAKWSPVPIRVPARCSHQREVCRECVESWAQDYDTRFNPTARERLGIAADVYVVPSTFPLPTVLRRSA